MKLIMLGTGNAGVLEHYNTCFLLEDEQRSGDDRYFLTDAGGGGRILGQLKKAGCRAEDIHEVFVTHKHLDHILGVFWLLRMVCQNLKKGSHEGVMRIYGHDEVIGILKDMSARLLDTEKVPGFSLHVIFQEVHDGETVKILGRDVTFFDIQSTKAKQFGYVLDLGEGRKLTCCGDEPCSSHGMQYARASTWLLHEAFCLDEDSERFHPYEKHHSSVKDACELAEKLAVCNLVLYHTEEETGKDRQRRYLDEGRKYFGGRLFVPEDLDVIDLEQDGRRYS